MAGPKKSKRVSMRGMGADAFFGLPSEAEEEKDTTIPENQQADKPDSQSTDLPASQHSSTPVGQHTDIPVSQETIIPANQDSGIQASQRTDIPPEKDASMPVPQQARKLIKVSYYIYEDQDDKLEQIRLQRRLRREKVDKSALIREAIDKLKK